MSSSADVLRSSHLVFGFNYDPSELLPQNKSPLQTAAVKSMCLHAQLLHFFSRATLLQFKRNITSFYAHIRCLYSSSLKRQWHSQTINLTNLYTVQEQNFLMIELGWVGRDIVNFRDMRENISVIDLQLKASLRQRTLSQR